MASDVVVIRRVSWAVLLPSVILMATAMVVGWRVEPENGMWWGMGIYLAYGIVARSFIAAHHRRGISLVRRGNYAAALVCFERSFAFFDRFRLLDRCRGPLMMSASRACYREMALANVAYCQLRLNALSKARQTYQRCLDLFPDSDLARRGLQKLNAAMSRE
jgi:hypothetical protein